MPINEYDDIILSEKEATFSKPNANISQQPTPVEPEQNDNEYNQILSGDRESRKQQLAGSMLVASKTDPARMARVLKIAKEVGLSPGTVDRNLDKVEQQKFFSDNEYDQLIEKSPGTARFMQDPHNAALAKDDIDSLKKMDGAIRVIPKRDTPSEFMEFGGEMKQASTTGWYNLKSSVMGLSIAFGKGGREAIEQQAEFNRKAKYLSSKRPDYSTEFQSIMEEEGKDVNKAWKKFTSSFGQWSEGKKLEALKNFVVGDIETIAETLDLLRHAVIRPKGLSYSVSENVVNAAPALGFSMAGGGAGTLVAPGLGTAIGAGSGAFVGSSVAEVGSMINEQLEERGYDITDPDQLESAYNNPQLMADIRAQALKKGLTTAAVDALFSAFAGPALSKLGKAGKATSIVSKAKAVAKDTAQEMVGETLGEFSGRVAQYDGDLSRVDLSASIQEGITSLGQSVITATAMGTLKSARYAYNKNPMKASDQVVEDTGTAVKTLESAQALVQLGQAIAESKNIKDVPDKVAEAIMATSENGEVRSVYYQTDDWDNYWNSKGESPAEKAAEVMEDGGKSYNESKANGIDMEIPLDKFASKLATTEDFAPLVNDAKTLPDGMKVSEAVEHMKNLPATMSDIANEAIEQEGKAESENADIYSRTKQIKKEVEDQLVKAGRPRREAKFGAEQVAAFYRTQALRNNMTPEQFEQFYNENKITIGEGGSPEISIGNNIEAPKTIEETYANPKLSEEYSKLPESEGGKVIDPDLLRQLYAPYTATEDGPLLYSKDLDNHVGLAASKIYQEKLSEPHDGGYVSLLAGGPASGKSEYRKHFGKTANADVTYDATSSNYKYAKERIEQALASRRPVVMTFVYNDFNEAVKRNKSRFKREKRLVDPDYMADAHVKSLDTFLKLQEEYKDNPRVTFEAFDARSKDFVHMSIDKLAELRYDKDNKSLEDAIKELEGIASEELKTEVEQVSEAKRAGEKRAREDQSLSETSRRNAGQGNKTYFQGLNNPDRLGFYITDKLKNSAMEGIPLFQGDSNTPLGQTVIGKDGINIQLFNRANPSTFIHETGHAYLEIMTRLYNNENTAQDVKDDFKRIMDFLEVNSPEEIKTEHHEKFARAYEAYAREGNAPSSALRKAFINFKTWLHAVYRRLTELNVELSDDIRDVFDKMLATEEEIAEAKGYISTEFDIESLEPATNKEAEYLAAVHEWEEAAKEDIATKLLRDMAKKKQKEYLSKREVQEKEVEAIANNLLVYKAISIMKNGVMPDGSKLPDGVSQIKLERSSLKQLFGDNITKILPKGIVAPIKEGGGVDVNMAAGMFGFEDADQMIQVLANSPTKEEFIKIETDNRMNKLHPELIDSSPERMRAEAMESVHNDHGTKVKRMQFEMIAAKAKPLLKEGIRKVAARLPTNKQMKEAAQRTLQDKKMNSVKPIVFLRAERKAARDAGVAMAKGDFHLATEFKKKELFNYELYRASMEFVESEKKALQFFKSVLKSDEKLAKTRDIDYINAARALLSYYGIGKAADKSPSQYLEKVKSYDPEAYGVLSNLIEASMLPIETLDDMTVADFNQLADTVRAIWDMAKTSMEHIVDGKALSKAAVIEELSDRLADLTKSHEKAGYDKKATKWENFKGHGLSFRAILRRVESWCDAADGDKGKIFTKYIWEPVSEAATQYRLAKAKYLKIFVERTKELPKAVFQERIIEAKELSRVDGDGVTRYYKFSSVAEIIGAMLHIGNESNKKKLLLGRKWGTLNEDGTLNSGAWDKFLARMMSEGIITKEHMDYVQSLWDQMEALKPMAQKTHKGRYGYYFNEITSDPIQTPWGVYKGGYAPAVPDTNISEDAKIRQEKNQLEGINNSFNWPSTPRGFTKDRVENYATPLSIDLRLVPSHLDQALKFIYMEPAVQSVSRIIMDKGFRETLSFLDPAIGTDMLVPWLQRAAQQRASMSTNVKWFDQICRTARRNTSMSAMFLNVTNSMQQFTGFGITAIKVKPKHIRNAVWQFTRSPKEMAEYIRSKSAFMVTRTDEGTGFVQEQIEDVLVDRKNYDNARNFMQKHAYILQSGCQNFVDYTTWLGAYEQAVEENLSEKEAVRAADAAVRLTQGSLAPEDMSRIESGTPFQRMFTIFYSYFNMQANALGTEFTKIARDMGLRKGAGRALYVYFFGFLIPAFFSEVIVQAMAGADFDEDDDDSTLDDVMALFFSSQFRTGTAMVPFAGGVINATVNQFNSNMYDDRITTSPAISTLEQSLVKAPYSTYKALVEDGSKKRAAKDILSTIGLLSGIPTGQIGKTSGYLLDVYDGKAEPEGPVDFTRGVVTGRTPR